MSSTSGATPSDNRGLNDTEFNGKYTIFCVTDNGRRTRRQVISQNSITPVTEQDTIQLQNYDHVR